MSVLQGPSSSDTTTDGNGTHDSKSTKNALYALIDGGCYIVHHTAILEIAHEVDEALLLPPSFTLCFDDVNMKIYLALAPASSTEYHAAAQDLQGTVDTMIRELKEDPGSSRASPPPAAEPLPNSEGQSEAGKDALRSKVEAWEKLVDSSLKLSVLMIRGEAEAEGDLYCSMDECAAQLRAATVHVGERMQLHAVTFGARRAAERQVDEALGSFIADCGAKSANADAAARRAVEVARRQLREAYEAQLFGDLLPAHPA